MGTCFYTIVDPGGKVLDFSEMRPERLEIHSCAKPFQLLPIFMLKLVEQYGLTQQEITVMASSSLAQPEHVEVIERLLVKTGIRREELFLQPTAPAGRIAFQHWLNAGKDKSIIYHPCIGNHIAMLLCQRALTGSGTNYLNPDSPIQRMIIEIIQAFCGETDIGIQIDTCGAPGYILSPRALAIAYSKLTGSACNRDLGEMKDYIRQMRRSFSRFPVLLEGDGCLSTILTSFHGIFAKTGKNCILSIALDDLGYGLVVGSNDHHWLDVARTVIKLLYELGFRSEIMKEELFNLQ